MKTEHRPGRLHKNADGLRRRPCQQRGQKIPDKAELKECVNQVSLRGETESGEIKDAQSKDKDTLTSQPVHFSLTFQLRADLKLCNSCYCSRLQPFRLANHCSIMAQNHENRTGYEIKFDWSIYR